MNVVAIVGPTASGKSEIAETVASRYGAAVVSVDSMQAYRRMDIGTAKPSTATRSRIDYRMLDIVDPSEEMSVMEFQRLGKAEIDDAIASHGRVVIAGGSGLHFRSLVDPLDFEPTDPDVRTRIAGNAPAENRGALLAIDPSAPDHVAMDNPRRVIRALEVYEITGLTPSERASRPAARAVAEYRPDVAFVGIGVDAGDESDARVTARFDSMLDAGLLAEVASLVDGLGVTASQAIGYKELVPVVRGEAALADARAGAISATRAFVKRQRTFFRRDPRISWLDWSDDATDRVESACRMIERATKWIS